MGSLKRLKNSDVSVNSYNVNKKWDLNSCQIDNNDIKILKGTKLTGSFYSIDDPMTNGFYERVVYEWINNLFYQINDTPLDPSLLNNSLYVGDASIERPYNLYNKDNNPNIIRNFPINNNEGIRVVVISPKIYGNKVNEGSIQLISNQYNITDDSKGNLFDGFTHIGNIFYAYGILVITNQEYQEIFTLPPLATTQHVSFSLNQPNKIINLLAGGAIRMGHYMSGSVVLHGPHKNLFILDNNSGSVEFDSNTPGEYYVNFTLQSFIDSISCNNDPISNVGTIYVRLENTTQLITPTPSNTPSITPSPSTTVYRTPTPSISRTVSLSISVTPTINVSITPTNSVSATPTITPTSSITASRSATPSISVSASMPNASVTPTNSITPTSTPSNSTTPTNTPTNSPTGTPIYSSTPTASVTSSVTSSITLTPTSSVTNTPTNSLTSTPTISNSSTRTPTPTSSMTATPTSTPTSSPTNTPTNSLTATPTNTATATRTPTNSVTPTTTPTTSNSATRTPTISVTNTPTSSVTLTPTPTISSTATPTNSVSATRTPTPTISNTSSITPTNSPTATPTISNSSTRTPTPTVSITSTSTPTPTSSITPTPTSSITPTPSATRTATPTPTSSITMTSTPTPTPTNSATRTPTPTISLSVSAASCLFDYTYIVENCSFNYLYDIIYITPTPTPTRTSTPTPTRTPTPTSTRTSTPTSTPTIAVSSTPSAPAPNFTGTLDAGTCDYVGGWAANLNSLNTIVSVDIYLGSNKVATVVANESRVDVANAIGSTTNSLFGFSYLVPPIYRSGVALSWSARIANTNITLAGSPKISNICPSSTLSVINQYITGPNSLMEGGALGQYFVTQEYNGAPPAQINADGWSTGTVPPGIVINSNGWLTPGTNQTTISSTITILVRAQVGPNMLTKSVQIIDATASNPPPTINRFPDSVITATGIQTFNVSSVFTDTDALTWSAVSWNDTPLPAGITFNPVTQVLSVAADYQNGSLVIRLKASDTANNQVQSEFLLIINRPISPTVTIVSTQIVGANFINEGATLKYELRRTFSDGTFTDFTSQSTKTLEGWLPGEMIDNAGFVSIPINSVQGDGHALLVIMNMGGVRYEKSVQVVDTSLAGPNNPPVVEAQTLFLTSYLNTPATYMFPASFFSDPDNDPLTWSILYSANGGATFGPLPSWSKFLPAPRLWTLTPPTQGVTPTQSHRFRKLVSDGRGGTAFDDFNLIVAPIPSDHTRHIDTIQIRSSPNKLNVNGIEIRVKMLSSMVPRMEFSRGVSIPDITDNSGTIPAFLQDGFQYGTTIVDAPHTGPQVICIGPISGSSARAYILIQDKSATDAGWVTVYQNVP